MNRPYRIKAVLFDFDGTLTRPGAIDFALIRSRIGCPDDTAILEFIQSLTDEVQRQEAVAELHRHEIAAAAASTPNSGAEDTIADLKAIGLKVGVISRNSRVAIDRALENFQQATAADIDLLISRDDPVAPKPEPDGILHAAECLDVAPEEVLVVGDFIFDVEAGRRAGALTAFITNGEEGSVPPGADFTIHTLADLLPLVHLGIPLPGGKLPHDHLDAFLGEFHRDDASVLIWPGVGEDTAAVNIDKEDSLVLTSDPITFATDAIGEYAVLVNANDVATSGAIPRWFLTSLLFPLGSTASMVRHVMDELAAVCKRCGITLCGGHTEITDAVNRPVVTGMLAGTVSRDRLLDKKRMRPGDHILLTKGVAVEGTAILAREFEGRLIELGVPRATIVQAKTLLSHISVLDEARIAVATEGVSALHDVTEGGLATALEELSIAGAFGIEVQVSRIPILAETRAVCGPLKIDPLGLIGSGSLLICCRPHATALLLERLEASHIRAARIGTVVEAPPGISALDGEAAAPWPRFHVDEIARLFA
jgi:hydrogenase expression/formation protein HypE